MFISYNIENYNNGGKYISGYEFSKWLNNVFLKNNLEYSWIKNSPSKSNKRAIMNADKSFRNFFKGKTKFPKFKKKKNQDTTMYLVRNNPKDFIIQRHKVKVPSLGYIRLKEFGYLPKNVKIISCTISKKCNKYFASFIIEVNEKKVSNTNEYSEGIGIDLGIKDFAIISNGKVYKNINKTKKVKKIEKKLSRLQRKLSRRVLNYKNRLKKGEATRNNLDKIIYQIQKNHLRLHNIRTDYINKIVNELVRTKPTYITIENLNVRGMMKNKYLSKSIQNQKFYEFRVKLQAKCVEYGIELRIANRNYPSSKTCNNCGTIKTDLKLKDRTYTCTCCGYTNDRDLNASLNLRDTTMYKLA